MNDIRCTGCRKLLAKASCGQLQIKCPRCKKLNQLIATSCQHERHRTSESRGKHREKTDAQKTRLS